MGMFECERDQWLDDAIGFIDWIISLDDDDPESPGRQERKTITLTKIIEKAREIR